MFLLVAVVVFCTWLAFAGWVGERINTTETVGSHSTEWSDDE